ncbi:nucleotidyltransferase [bacterium]|nr:nucleotidyltransferase [bacterium]
MAKTVLSAFNEFMKNEVNLDSDNTRKARVSRDWLVNQINMFPENNSDFPVIYEEKSIFFGSFARKTKKRPLDDIDIMIALEAQNCTYSEFTDRIEINVPNNFSVFEKYCDKCSFKLNSISLINEFKNNLQDISQYSCAEIKRNQEAVTLQMQSYDWNFDIVPCFITKVDENNRNYYLIPDGKGNWKKTDPRIDRDRVTKINSTKNGKILPVIRIIKYWNKRATMPSISSYLLENMILDYYEGSNEDVSEHIHIEVKKILSDLISRVYHYVNDPKNIQGDINNLTMDEKNKLSYRADRDDKKAFEAIKHENRGDMEKSIRQWKEIFGISFPEYK